ncbi:MAG: AMP-binding protein [Salinivirgaceae bacterium]|nr:AMP-binding protein [Salinivirgaceae bacterium]
MDKKLTISNIWDSSVIKFANSNAFSIVDDEPITYKGADNKVNGLMAFIESCNLQTNDKVAILSQNMPNWAITYFTLAKMGIVCVPLLPDFSSFEIDTILCHSEAKALFISENLLYKINEIKSDFIDTIIKIDDFSIVKGNKVEYNENNKAKEHYSVNEDDLASIIYTSGTTGNSKGVMLTQKNIAFCAIQSATIQEINENDRWLSILPLSHAYENTIGMMLPVYKGSCIYYLSKPPTPSILLPALKKIRPTLMLSVPLIIEKIYRNKVLAEINSKTITKTLYKIPFLRKKFNLIAGKKLYETFGGELKFFGIGGAKLDRNVEIFLREAKFPYAIGYGLTETAPLLAGTNSKKTKLQSTGPVMQGVQIKLNNANPETGEGEIWAKGENVMKGYYKEPNMTKQVFSDDGWFKTGDLGAFDKDNFLFIKGRIKNIIVGANGENIYPEEIESVINNFRYVVESLVIEKKGKLVAMVHFNREDLEKRYKHVRSEVENFMDEILESLTQDLQIYINQRVNKSSKVQIIIVHPQPFHKTATHKIKRFMYN